MTATAQLQDIAVLAYEIRTALIPTGLVDASEEASLLAGISPPSFRLTLPQDAPGSIVVTLYGAERAHFEAPAKHALAGLGVPVLEAAHPLGLLRFLVFTRPAAGPAGQDPEPRRVVRVSWWVSADVTGYPKAGELRADEIELVSAATDESGIPRILAAYSGHDIEHIRIVSVATRGGEGK